MDVSLLAILAFCLSYAAALYYFIFVRREARLGPWGRSGLVTLLFVITPVLAMILWYQSGAESRLEGLGFNSYPGFVSSSGIATGVGDAPIWVFTIVGDEDSVLLFYKQSENHAGWTLVSESDMGLVFERGSEKLSILVGEGNVVFSIKPGT